MGIKFKTDEDREGVQRVLNYVRPKCPGCGEDMQLSVQEHDNFYTGEGTFYSAFWYCANAVTCRGRWSTGYSTSLNVVLAAEDAYKAALDRV